jgi:2-polyprenyl-3-methyl-5-hydroxy-6-metoxy-1,4-benzoquinol methylase
MHAVSAEAGLDVAAARRCGRAECAAAARRLFDRGPLLRRLMQQGRPLICPFERVIDAVPPGSVVLDAGCGDGLLLGLLATFGRVHEGLGFDASAAAIRNARRMRAHLPPSARVAFERRDAGAPWPAGRYDVVTLVDLLHHVPPAAQRAVLQEAARRVAPGGLLVCKDMADAPRWRALVSHLHDLLVARQRIHLVPFGVVRDVLEQCGLVLERHERIATGPYLHELGVFRRPPAPASPVDHRPDR